MIDSRGRRVIQLDELTLKQKEYFLKNIWNGVGSREYPDVPDFIFGEASKYHDFAYFRGGDENDRKEADRDFFHRAHSAVRKQPLLKRPFYYVLSYTYFYSLKKLGGKAWEYYPAPAKNWNEWLAHVNTFFDREPQFPRPPKFQE